MLSASFAAVSRGLFVTFEGIDRSGKTTQARLLADALGEEAVAVRDPGSTEVGEVLRKLLKRQDANIGSRTEALLFAASRAETAEKVIRPSLQDGLVVISDRYIDSTLAYQGAGRGLGVEPLAQVNEWGTDGLKPDLTVLLQLPATAAAARAGDQDRFEAEGVGLQEKVRLAYEELAGAEPDRWRAIDATRPADDIHAAVLGLVRAAQAEVAG
jgi:dTMP kinase